MLYHGKQRASTGGPAGFSSHAVLDVMKILQWLRVDLNQSTQKKIKNCQADLRCSDRQEVCLYLHFKDQLKCIRQQIGSNARQPNAVGCTRARLSRVAVRGQSLAFIYLS